jgi:hypothetical protein
MKTFTEFWRGMFFLVSTVAVSIVLYLLVIVWQPLWTEGFRNFGDISQSIIRLDRTAQPVAEMAPLILGVMEDMHITMVNMQQSMETIEKVNPSVMEMNKSINHMIWVMEHRMGAMLNQMDRVGDKMSPFGMMPSNW